MAEIIIRKDGDQWAAFAGDKRIGGSGCKACIVKIITNITRTSEKYTHITVMDAEGNPSITIPTGARSEGNSQENLQRR